jgi:hypothetical protein
MPQKGAKFIPGWSQSWTESRGIRSLRIIGRFGFGSCNPTAACTLLMDSLTPDSNLLSVQPK